MANHPFQFEVSGPFKIKPKGNAIGINLLPLEEGSSGETIFSRSGPQNPIDISLRTRNIASAGVVVTSCARRIIELSKGGEKVNFILVSGDGEPTKHPGFVEITENLRDLRDKWFPKAKLILYSKALELESADQRHAVTIYDRPTIRFEWGTAKTFTSMTGEPGPALKTLQAALTPLEKLVVQACFMKVGSADNSTDAEVKGWLKRVVELRPTEVEITTVQTKTKDVRPVTDNRLEAIAAQATEALGEVPVVLPGAAVQPA